MNRTKWIILLWIILALFTILQLAAVEYFAYYDYQWKDYLLTPGASLVTGIILCFVILIPSFDFSKRFKIIPRILFLSVFGIFYSVIFVLLMHIFPLVFSKNPSDYMESIFSFSVKNFHNVVKNYLFQIAILYTYEYLNKEKFLSEKQKDLEVELSNTKLQMLKNQLQPHFLFNSLNSIVSEIDENKSKAQEMLINLSDILRFSLQSDFSTPVTLQEELELIKKYLSIEKIRYDNQLDFTIQTQPEMLSQKVPNLILQALVENAVKHGYKTIHHPLEIVIEAKNNTIFVKNNGQKLGNHSFGIGINNVKQRLLLFTQNENSFQIYQQENWVINQINLP